MALDRAAYARAFFESKGYSPVQAAGIVGNLMQESTSSLNSGIVGDAGASHGIAQWNGDRLRNLQGYAKSQSKPWQDFDTQLQFVHNELQGPESAANKRLLAATDIPSATRAFATFERPGNPMMDRRIAYASQVAGVPVPASYTQEPVAPRTGPPTPYEGNQGMGISPAAVAPAGTASTTVTPVTPLAARAARLQKLTREGGTGGLGAGPQMGRYRSGVGPQSLTQAVQMGKMKETLASNPVVAKIGEWASKLTGQPASNPVNPTVVPAGGGAGTEDHSPFSTLKGMLKK